MRLVLLLFPIYFLFGNVAGLSADSSRDLINWILENGGQVI